ncbi:hypothetical protein KIL84_002810 [Mauremys mutica]|uniref:Uncharacterized protein n=1 Tax=Mauremys mutica TaxID=74926 RepID=A0A9D3WUD9_9SAUR|nr:hypothetical protein KIL84_002810 [Mauremys mutica]
MAPRKSYLLYRSKLEMFVTEVPGTSGVIKGALGFGMPPHFREDNRLDAELISSAKTEFGPKFIVQVWKNCYREMNHMGKGSDTANYIGTETTLQLHSKVNWNISISQCHLFSCPQLTLPKCIYK